MDPQVDNQNNSNQPTYDNSPEQLAARAFSKDSSSPSYEPSKKLPPHKRFAQWHKNLSKKQKLILLFVALLIVGGACYMTLKIMKNDSTQLSQVQVIQQPTTVQSILTGLPVKPEVNEKQVLGVMIENSPDARPQSGLKDAGVVFEAVAEGGITRFLAIFQDTSSEYIGPVRSVRPYYVEWIKGFDGSIAHVGGSPDGLQLIKSLKVKDLDQFANPGPYERISARSAPHNVYTSTKKLRNLEKQKGFKKSSFTGFARAKKEVKADAITAQTINMNLSGPLYNVSYSYDATSNAYKRKVGGERHIDEKSGKQITPKVVIALVMKKTNNGVYSVYKTTGEGKAIIFQNGTAIKGKWQKKDRKASIVFTDSEGKAIQLAPGKTWLTAVTDGAVTYKK